MRMSTLTLPSRHNVRSRILPSGENVLLWLFCALWLSSDRPAESAVRERSACGNRASGHIHFRIVNGVISQRGMWPWQIGIYEKSTGNVPGFRCGGALISPRWVLTAAHCFFDMERKTFRGHSASRYLIKAGVYNRSRHEPWQQKIVPEKILVHEEFNESSFVDGDIALVKLNKEVNLNRYVRTVCVPEKDEGDLATPRKTGFVAGWGVTRALIYGEDLYPSDLSDVLRHANFTIQSDRLCLNKSRNAYNSTMTFCAGDGKGIADSCLGDSGGAFVRRIRRSRHPQWVVVGIVSWGYGCAQKDEYGYYTRVYPFVRWINRTMVAHSCDTGEVRDVTRNCVEFNECSIANGGCSHGCVNTLGSYFCTCPSGYHLFYETCWDIDECSRRNGGCSHGCVNTPGGHHCTCPSGYRLYYRRRCWDINECLEGNGGCSHDCVDTEGSYYCTCRKGYYRFHHKMCRDTDECRIRNGGCSQECVNTNGSYYCTCSWDFELSSNGRTCRRLFLPSVSSSLISSNALVSMLVVALGYVVRLPWQ